MPMEIEGHARLDLRHTECGQLSTEVVLDPQYDFQQCQFVLPHVLDPLHTQFVAFRAVCTYRLDSFSE